MARAGKRRVKSATDGMNGKLVALLNDQGAIGGTQRQPYA